MLLKNEYNQVILNHFSLTKKLQLESMFIHAQSYVTYKCANRKYV